MSDWRIALKADPTEWLLEHDNPSVRYFTLRHICDRSDDDSEVQQAREDIMQFGIVPEILRRQHDPEYVERYHQFYTYTYRGLVWTLIVLAELGASRCQQIEEQCEYIFRHSQETEEGGFAVNAAVRVGGGRISEVIPCLTGNMVWSLVRLGYIDDARTQKAINWLTGFMRLNDGTDDDPQSPPYDRYEMCWGKHTCHMGVVKALKALSAVPASRRTQAVNDTISKAVEFMLIHHVHKRSHNLNRTSKPGWLKFGFPLMYQTDVLEILDILSELGVKDKRTDDAFDHVISKQDGTGRWTLENTYNSDRLLVPMGQAGEQSKWLTLRALRVMKRRHELT